jgi:hypothetical protein
MSVRHPWFDIMPHMAVGDWITLIAVVIALTFGVLALVQTNRIQKKQYRHLLINEIIDWATEIIDSFRIENVPIVGNTDLETARKRVLTNKFFKLWGLDSKTEYMKHIATSFPEVSDKLTEVGANLNALLEIFREVVHKKEEKPEDILDSYFRRLDKSAEEVIQLAIQVKTKELI